MAPNETLAQLQSSVEIEKTALARTLHDAVGGYLIAATMDVAEMSRITPQQEGRRKLKRIKEELTRALELTRRISEELHPSLLDNVGLFAALRWQFKARCQHTQLRCSAQLPEAELRLSEFASITLFRVGQELTDLAAARTDVTRLELKVAVLEGCLTLSVFADGEGIGSVGAVAIPVNSIRQRLLAIGGSLRLWYPPGGGTCFSAAAPLEAIAPERAAGFCGRS